MGRPEKSARIGSRIVWLGAALALLGLVVSCGGDNGSGPTGTPPLTGNQAVQASLGIATGTFASVGAIFDGIPDLDELGGSKMASGLHPNASLLMRALGSAAVLKDRVDAATRVPIPCAGGGTRDLSCTSDESGTHLSGVFANCVVPDTINGGTTTINGSVSVDVAQPGLCFVDSLPDSVAVTIAFNEFSLVVRDSDEVIVENFAADLTLALAPTGAGCDGQNGTISLDGTLNAISFLDDVNLSLIADNLVITSSSAEVAPVKAGSAGLVCVSTVVMNGGVFVSDGDEEFSETLTALTFTNTDYGLYALATVNGTVATNCTGALTFETIEPIYLVQDGCPTGGIVEVTLPNNVVARIVFTDTGGIAFDYGADDTIDATFESCDDPDIASCHYPS